MSDGFINLQNGQVAVTSGSSVPLLIPNIYSLGAPIGAQLVVVTFASVDAVVRPGLAGDVANANITSGLYAPFNNLVPATFMMPLILTPSAYNVTFDHIHAIAVTSSGYVNYKFGYYKSFNQS